ncbi:MAG: biopolymer transporter ExbD [Gammaproteobacteria bacterium]|nr:biopolymer transporter ExbD [Gammaproteobacteria bacterium]
MRPRWQRAARRDVHTVDVTAFLSLMVILVPFLLVTAVFSRATILEIQPVSAESDQKSAPDPLQLQVIVRHAVIEVSYLGQTRAERIDRSSDDRALASLATLAGELKARFPQSLEATVLLEPQIPYDVLVQVLDVLRVKLQQTGDAVEQTELFPLIALGPVPASRQPMRGAQ